ncbi:MAG: hypothetical protein KA736_04520 [Crocinitomicaceae bacterium]|nr:hypothetical protein [Crocinitomicaceae bacterium]
MDKVKDFLLFVLLISSLFACSIDEAQPLANKKLVIASDFLYPKDARFFAELTKKEKVAIEIIHMRADSIQYRLKKDGFNTNIDLVFIKSLLGVKSLENQAFQPVQNAFSDGELSELKQIRNNWFLVGKDPFVISYLKDSLEKPSSYRELSSDYLWTSPDLASLEVLKAHVRYQFQKKQGNNKQELKDWLRGLKDHRVNYQKGTDSTASTQLLLLTYSTYSKNKLLVQTKKRKVIFPKQLYSDYFAMAVVPQAKNYAMTKLFLLFWNEKANSSKFLKHFGMTDLNRIKKGKGFYISPEEILDLLSKRI